MIACTSCKSAYPEEGLPYKCPECGGRYDFFQIPAFHADQVDRSRPGIWRYRHTFALPENAPLVTLGEGVTPLLWSDAFGRQVAFKLEYLNPTGSHKDRGIAVMTSLLKSRSIKQAVEDSSGNAGASFAAYASRAGIQARIFIPDYASGPKRAQIESYGAQVVRILGRRTTVTEAVKQAAEKGTAYASHANLPHLLTGYATTAYEIYEQLGKAPGTILVPAGHGSFLLGIGRGFKNLLAAGLIQRMPILIGVQAVACAPLWAVYTMGAAGHGFVTEGETLAEGVRVRYPVPGDAVLRIVSESQGGFVAVDEEAILPGRDELARRGFYVEPTSAIIWDALYQVLRNAPDPVVAVLTGSGFKYAL